MLNQTSYPLTHRDCIRAGYYEVDGDLKERRIFVQVRRRNREGSYVQCGELVELRVADEELFKVDTRDGTVMVTGRNARMCTGDGRCTCETECTGSEFPPFAFGGSAASPYVRTAEPPNDLLENRPKTPVQP